MEVEFLKSAFNVTQYPPPDRPEIAFAGRSNVGKSTLINVLVNRKKMAKTSSTPGRTQAINFFLYGERLTLVDLPGYGFARVPLSVKKTWGKMVEAYLQNRSNLKAVVVILDIRRDPASGDLDLLNWLFNFGITAIPVLTKADKLSRQGAVQRAGMIGKILESLTDQAPVVFSSRTRDGRDAIWKRIESAIES
ncbi:MAG: ribosome biogenesis GTP-binding protein YihA/YsxC [Pseudomonadota bacterium]